MTKHPKPPSTKLPPVTNSNRRDRKPTANVQVFAAKKTRKKSRGK